MVDKPHFLPVIPSGRFLRETLLTRLRLRPELQHLNVEDITPIHRLDKIRQALCCFRSILPRVAIIRPCSKKKPSEKPMKRWRRRGRIWTIRCIFRHEWNAAKNSSHAGNGRRTQCPHDHRTYRKSRRIQPLPPHAAHRKETPAPRAYDEFEHAADERCALPYPIGGR